jgi:hypothetical protein
MGDTNTIREFLEGQQLTDGWVQSIGKGVLPEVVDKIMSRGNNYVTLTLDKWNNENEASWASTARHCRTTRRSRRRSRAPSTRTYT